MEKNIMMQKVVCRTIRGAPKWDQIVVGKEYMLDRSTIWINSDGDVYGVIYDCDNHQRVGELLLSHFYTTNQ